MEPENEPARTHEDELRSFQQPRERAVFALTVARDEAYEQGDIEAGDYWERWLNEVSLF